MDTPLWGLKNWICCKFNLTFPGKNVQKILNVCSDKIYQDALFFKFCFICGIEAGFSYCLQTIYTFVVLNDN